MARRPAGTKSFVRSGTGITDALIKTGPGILYSVNLSWTGAAADDLLRIHDCATVADIAVTNWLYSFRFPAATGTYAAVLPSVGKEAILGLVFNLQASGAKLDVNIGYD